MLIMRENYLSLLSQEHANAISAEYVFVVAVRLEINKLK
jgi:hypothetical protein